jgi:glutamate racemase
MVVLACNTATLAALSPLRQRFPALYFVGTVPAVKPASLASKAGKIGVLGTDLTIK